MTTRAIPWDKENQGSEYYRAGSKDRWVSQLVRVIMVVVTVGVKHPYSWVLGASTLVPALASSGHIHLTDRGVHRDNWKCPVQASLLDHFWGTWNARIPCPSRLESDSRPCMSFFPKSIFLRVGWPVGNNISFTSSAMIWFPSHIFYFSWFSCDLRTSPSGRGRFHLNVLKFCS